VDWIGQTYEAPDTDVLVGLSIDDARRVGAAITGIDVIRELGPNSSYTFDHRADRLTLQVADGAVVAAARF
jgi:hypothetical protein